MVSSSYSSFTNYHNNLFCFKNINGPILEKSYTGNATIMDNVSPLILEPLILILDLKDLHILKEKQ
jgi:hypothetical protein